MSLAIAKKPSLDNKQKKKRDSMQGAVNNSHTIYSNFQVPIVQLKPNCPCGGGCPRCAPPIQPKLKVGAPGDIYEQEADKVAEQVMHMPQPLVQKQPEEEEEEEEMLQTKPVEISPLVQRQTAEEDEEEEEEEELIQPKQVGLLTPMMSPGLESHINSMKGRGQYLPSSTRAFFEPRFGYDFSQVRVHTDSKASETAHVLNAQAFTIGQDVIFGRGQYSPRTTQGRNLLAHELTHVVQQCTTNRIKETSEEASRTTVQKARHNGHQETNPVQTGSIPIRQVALTEEVQRETPAAAEPADPLCSSYVYIIAKIIIEGQINDLKATPSVEKRLDLIRELKWIWRCATETEKKEIMNMLKTGLGKETADAIWKEVSTPFGGYRGVYPGYYGGAKGRLERLGTSEVEAYEAFAYDPRSSAAATFLSSRETTATAEVPTLTATDLLYFYGHHYAQYKHPGVFANGTQTQFIDLRALTGKGIFDRVKLIVSTSCATCCKEAVETFTPLFPNAVILGYRKSAPYSGEAVRNAFDKGIRDLKRPLLLEEAVDVNAIIGVWKSVVERFHPNEATRLPGYYKDGTVHYLELGTWKSMPATDVGNSCRVKGSEIEEAAH